MKKIYRRQNRLLISIAVGLLLISFGGIVNTSQKNVMSWWGSIYPEFCFSEADYDNKNIEKITSEQKPKISFWLAKAFERW